MRGEVYIISRRVNFQKIEKGVLGMSINIVVKDILGENYTCEDAILIKELIDKNLSNRLVVDFAGYNRISSTFLTSLFSDLINKYGRDYIFKQIDVKNLSNYTDYSRVVLGTTFQ